MGRRWPEAYAAAAPGKTSARCINGQVPRWLRRPAEQKFGCGRHAQGLMMHSVIRREAS